MKKLKFDIREEIAVLVPQDTVSLQNCPDNFIFDPNGKKKKKLAKVLRPSLYPLTS